MMPDDEIVEDSFEKEEQKPVLEVLQQDIQENIKEEVPELVESKPMYPEEKPTDNTKFWVRKMNEGTPGGQLAPKGK